MILSGPLLPELLPIGLAVVSATYVMPKRLRLLHISLTGDLSTKELNFLRNVDIAGSGFSHLYLRDKPISPKCLSPFCYNYLCHLAVSN